MYRGIEVLDLVPDRPGRGGIKFGYHSFQQNPINDTREVLNVHVWQDAWRSDHNAYSFSTFAAYNDTYAITPSSVKTRALHGYSRFSTSDPAAGPTLQLLGHNVQASYGAHIWNYTIPMNGTYNGMVVPPRWDATTNVLTPNASVDHPAVFVNIGDRCFIGTGIVEGLIYDSLGHTDFESQGPGNVYAIGVGAPQAAPAVTSADVLDQTSVWVRKGSRYLSFPDSDSGLSTATSPGTDTLELTADGLSWESGPPDLRFDITNKTTVFGTTGMEISIPAGSNIGTVVLDTPGTEMLTNPSFTSSLTGWTAGANWSWVAGGAKHTAGSTATLAQNVTTVAGASYRVAFTISGNTVGSIGITLGTVPLSRNGQVLFTANGSLAVGITAATSASVALTITPTSNFNGTLDSVSLVEDVMIPADNSWVGLTLTADGVAFQVMATGTDVSVDDTPALSANEILLSNADGGIYSSTQSLMHSPFSLSGVRWRMKRAGAEITWPGGISLNPTVIGEMFNTGGRLTWGTTPPSYAYAWYDPLTGHLSNISPVFSPEATSKTDVGVRVPVDSGSISYPPTTSTIPTGATRWTHILFFRTLMAGGSTLYPIGSLSPTIPDPNVPGSTKANPAWRGLPNDDIQAIPPTTTGNYWYDDARDSELLVSGALRAPQFTNGKPTFTQNGATTVLYPAHMAFWDGRLWIAATQDPAALHYSCDRVQCPFGRPEESFSDTNVLRIPASDGCIRGTKLIGEQLLVTTERWAYTIAGNNESNYRLVRVSTRMAGVGDYQMDEFVSDVEGGGALVVFLGTDSKVYAMQLGGQAVWISKEIQTYLDSAQLYRRSQYNLTRVHCMSIAGRRMVLIYCPGIVGTSTSAPGKTLIYDFDQKIWTEHTVPNYSTTLGSGISVSWATVSTIYDSVAEVYSTPQPDITVPISPNPEVKCLRWFKVDNPIPNPSGHIRTFPLTFDGKKTRKQIHFVRIYVSDKSETTINPETGENKFGWRCYVAKDSGAVGTPIEFAEELDPAYKMLGGGVPVDSADAAELIVTDARLTSSAGPLLGYTFDVTIYFPDQIDKIYTLYKVQVGYSTVSNPGEVDP